MLHFGFRAPKMNEKAGSRKRIEINPVNFISKHKDWNMGVVDLSESNRSILLPLQSIHFDLHENNHICIHKE